jgi:hypothetical protein
MSARIAASNHGADIHAGHVLLGMDDEPELLGDDLDRAGIEIVGTRRLDLAGLVVTLPAVRVREDGISRGKFAKGADRAAAIGMGGLGLAAISPVDFVTSGIAPDPKNSIKVPHRRSPVRIPPAV